VSESRKLYEVVLSDGTSYLICAQGLDELSIFVSRYLKRAVVSCKIKEEF
jgi:hypothetical protein